MKRKRRTSRGRHLREAVPNLLPVALNVCGARLGSTGRPVSWLVDLLEDETDRLSEISYDEDRLLRAVFDDAYSSVSPLAQVLHRAAPQPPLPRRHDADDLGHELGRWRATDPPRAPHEPRTSRYLRRV